MSKITGRFVFLVSMSLISLKSYAVDTVPGALIAPPPDMNLIRFTYDSRQRGARYQDGRKAADTGLDIERYHLRYTRVGDYG